MKLLNLGSRRHFESFFRHRFRRHLLMRNVKIISRNYRRKKFLWLTWHVFVDMRREFDNQSDISVFYNENFQRDSRKFLIYKFYKNFLHIRWCQNIWDEVDRRWNLRDMWLEEIRVRVCVFCLEKKIKKKFVNKNCLKNVCKQRCYGNLGLELRYRMFLKK